MDDNQLDRNLRAVGKACFVEFYDQFNNPQLPNREVAILLEEERQCTWKSCLSRTSHARSIIREGRAKDALENIRDSDRVRDQSIKDEAARLAALL